MINFFLSLPLWMKIGIPIFFCVVIVMVIVAVAFKGFWKDKGFMLSEETGKPLHWPAGSTVGVIMAPGLPLFWATALSTAIHTINGAIGRDLLIPPVSAPSDYDWSKPPPRGFCTVKCDPSLVDRATTEHRYDLSTGEILSVSVTFPEESTFKIPMALHELGHVTGLDHDEHPESIMYPSLSIQRAPGVLSDDDKDRLRKTYAARS